MDEQFLEKIYSSWMHVETIDWYEAKCLKLNWLNEYSQYFIFQLSLNKLEASAVIFNCCLLFSKQETGVDCTKNNLKYSQLIIRNISILSTPKNSNDFFWFARNFSYRRALLAMSYTLYKSSNTFSDICWNKQRMTSKQYIDEMIGVRVL